jgi:Protein of unknown function (DUF3631)
MSYQGELDHIEQWLRRYLHYSNKHCATAHVLWCAHARLMEHWDISPRLGFFSALPGSGKTNALMLTSYLCAPDGRAGDVSVSISPAAFIRKAEEQEGRQPDLHPQFMDEIDGLYSAASVDANAALTTQILNGGYKRGAKYERMVGANNDQVKVWGSYGAVAMAGLGKARLPDSLTDRLIRVPMEPLKPGESVCRFRQRLLESGHRMYRDTLMEFCQWADGIIDLDAVPIPEALNGRDIDNWEPLLAVAEAAGENWPQRARASAVWFCAMKAMNKRDSLALRLLKEVVEYLRQETKAGTHQIWEHLYNKSGAPWRDLKFFNESWIRDTLYQFPGAPRQGDIRSGSARVQGFHIDWFADLIERYIGPDTPDTISNEINVVGSVGPEITPNPGGAGAFIPHRGITPRVTPYKPPTHPTALILKEMLSGLSGLPLWKEISMRRLNGSARLALVTAEAMRQRGYKVLDTKAHPMSAAADFALVRRSPETIVLEPLKPKLEKLMAETMLSIARQGALRVVK